MFQNTNTNNNNIKSDFLIKIKCTFYESMQEENKKSDSVTSQIEAGNDSAPSKTSQKELANDTDSVHSNKTSVAGSHTSQNEGKSSPVLESSHLKAADSKQSEMHQKHSLEMHQKQSSERHQKHSSGTIPEALKHLWEEIIVVDHLVQPPHFSQLSLKQTSKSQSPSKESQTHDSPQPINQIEASENENPEEKDLKEEYGNSSQNDFPLNDNLETTNGLNNNNEQTNTVDLQTDQVEIKADPSTTKDIENDQTENKADQPPEMDIQNEQTDNNAEQPPGEDIQKDESTTNNITQDSPVSAEVQNGTMQTKTEGCQKDLSPGSDYTKEVISKENYYIRFVTQDILGELKMTSFVQIEPKENFKTVPQDSKPEEKFKKVPLDIKPEEKFRKVPLDIKPDETFKTVPLDIKYHDFEELVTDQHWTSEASYITIGDLIPLGQGSGERPVRDAYMRMIANQKNKHTDSPHSFGPDFDGNEIEEYTLDRPTLLQRKYKRMLQNPDDKRDEVIVVDKNRKVAVINHAFETKSFPSAQDTEKKSEPQLLKQTLRSHSVSSTVENAAEKAPSSDASVIVQLPWDFKDKLLSACTDFIVRKEEFVYVSGKHPTDVSLTITKRLPPSLN